MPSNALAAFNRRVKKLKKQHPKMSHKQAQKAASRAHKKKVLGTKRHVKHKVSSHKHKTRKRVAGVSRSPDRGADNKRVDISIGSITAPQAERLALSKLKEQAAWAHVAKSSATKVAAKRKIQKKINNIMAKVRALEK